MCSRSVPSDLLSFLCDDGSEEGDKGAFVSSVSSKYGLRFGEGTEDNVGEGLGEGDGLGEVSDGEGVFAGFDCGLAATHEDAVYACCVELFLLEVVSA